MTIEFDKQKISSVVISTAFGHSGRGLFPYYFLPSHLRIVQLARESGITTIAKSATRHKRKGNFRRGNPFTYRYVQRIPGTKTGMLNSYGLSNPGVIACAKKIRKSLEKGADVIPSFYPEFDKGTEAAIEDTLQAIQIYLDILGPFFWALELNYSCPNSQEKITQNMAQALECSKRIRKRFPWLIQIAKISIVHPYDFVAKLADVADVIHSINTIPYELIYDSAVNPSPLADVGGGGVSGSPAKHKAFAYNEGLVERVKTNFIFGCGVEDDDDYADYCDLATGLKGYAVSFCSAVIRMPEDTYYNFYALMCQ